MLEKEEEEADTAMTCWGAWSVVLRWAWSVVLGWAWLVLPHDHLAVLIQLYLLFGSENQDRPGMLQDRPGMLQDRHWKIQHGFFPLKHPPLSDSFVPTATIFFSVLPLVVLSRQEQMTCEW